MEEVTAARRYARALFDICRERHLVDRVAAELQTVHDVAGRVPDLRALLTHPEIPVQEKRRVLLQILPDSLAQETLAFLNLLLEHRDLHLLPEIREAFLDLRHEAYGVLKATVETPTNLTRESRDELREALEQATGRSIIII